MTIQLKSIATTHPQRFAEQDEILEFFVAGRRSEIDVQEAASIYANTGIGRRYIARPPAWFALEHSAAERNEVYLEAAAEQGQQGISVRGFYEPMWPETVDLMGWGVDALGLDVILSREVPSFVHRQTAEVVDRAMAVQGLRASDIARVVCHPGGTKVLSAVEAAHGLAAGALDAERATLRKAGNMSSPTVFFVLKQVLEDGHHGTLMLTAFGPGFSVNFAAIDAKPGALGFARHHRV